MEDEPLQLPNDSLQMSDSQATETAESLHCDSKKKRSGGGRPKKSAYEDYIKKKSSLLAQLDTLLYLDLIKENETNALSFTKMEEEEPNQFGIKPHLQAHPICICSAPLFNYMETLWNQVKEIKPDPLGNRFVPLSESWFLQRILQDYQLPVSNQISVEIFFSIFIFCV